MSEKSATSSKSHFSYEEGHKRETRKSYQAYVQEMTGSNTEESSSATCDDASDDNNVRRSRRTPVPKRSFKLIDDYDTKESAKKKSVKEGRGKTNKKMKAAEETSEIKEQPSVELNLDKVEAEDDNEVTPRKSSRAPKPKKFQDSIAPPCIKKPHLPKQENAELVDEKQISKSKRRKSKENAAHVEFLSPAESAKLKKSRKSTSEVTEPQSSPTKTKRTKGGEIKSPEKAKPVKKSNKRKRSVTDDKKGLPSEELDTSQESSPKKQKKKPMYESYVTTGSKKYVAVEKEEEEQGVEQEDIVKDLKSPSKKKKKKKKKRVKEKEEVKVTTLPKKKTTTTPPKLIVSFKKSITASDKKKQKTSVSRDDGIEKAVTESSMDVQIPPTDAPATSADINTTPTLETPTTPMEGVEEKLPHQKKNKKKIKKKLDSKNQKVVDVKTFLVEDENVVKVKKKKIYKKRGSKKMLVRIIKNHCNANGEIVKTETVLVDNVPVEDDAGKVDEVSETKNDVLETLDFPIEENNDVEVPWCDYDENEMQSDIKTEPIDQKEAPTDVSGEDASRFEAEKTKAKKSTLKKSSKKVVSKKTSLKAQKKALSRPANKNVTVGGKVVGKTTKGMKKTGVAVLDKVASPKSPTKKTASGGEVSVACHSEPKNAYNLFCRKYRPIIVQQHPKADFAEISRRLAALWNTASVAEKQEHRERFNEIQSSSRAKMYKLNRTSPSLWTETEFKYIKKAISEKEAFSIPTYSVRRLQPVDFAAHLQLLGDSLTVIAGALEQQSAMTVHGAMSVLLDSMLCALPPLLFLTSCIPEIASVDEDQQARTLDNIAYILPGL